MKARHLRVGEHIATSGQLSSFGTIGRATIVHVETHEGENVNARASTILELDQDGTPWHLHMHADAVVLLAADEELRR